MSKKKRHEEHENHERWLVSYADFITLLFAFFTVLYATAQTDEQKLQAVVDGVNAVFDGGMPLAILDMMSSRNVEFNNVQPLHWNQDNSEPLIHTMRRNLMGSLSDNVVQIGLVDQDLVIVLPMRLTFAEGSAELHPSAYGVLVKIASQLKDLPVEIEVIGVADAVPVTAGSRWEDNWALASARSLATVRYLVRKGMPVNSLKSTALVTTRDDQEARAVELRIRINEPGPAAEVEEVLRAETESAP